MGGSALVWTGGCSCTFHDRGDKSWCGAPCAQMQCCQRGWCAVDDSTCRIMGASIRVIVCSNTRMDAAPMGGFESSHCSLFLLASGSASWLASSSAPVLRCRVGTGCTSHATVDAAVGLSARCLHAARSDSLRLSMCRGPILAASLHCRRTNLF
jgi:hypothetical protein